MYKKNIFDKRYFYAVWYGLVGHKIEVIVFVVSIVAIILSYIFNKFSLILPITAFVVALVVLFLRFFEDRDYIYYLPLKNRKEKNSWFGRGLWGHDRSKNIYYISESPNGFIFSKCLLWDNYYVSFDFMLVQPKNVCGFVLRARGLSDYIMLQCGCDRIVPHVRHNHKWDKEIITSSSINHINNLKSGLWYKAEITCNNYTISYCIKNKKEIMANNSWEIPVKDVLNKDGSGFNTDLYSYNYGTIGFRCDGKEKSYIKNLLIERI